MYDFVFYWVRLYRVYFILFRPVCWLINSYHTRRVDLILSGVICGVASTRPWNYAGSALQLDHCDVAASSCSWLTSTELALRRPRSSLPVDVTRQAACTTHSQTSGPWRTSGFLRVQHSLRGTSRADVQWPSNQVASSCEWFYIYGSFLINDIYFYDAFCMHWTLLNN